MTSAITVATVMKTRGVIASRSTTSGMIDRKNTITFGLPRVSDNEPAKARQPRVALAGASAPATAPEARAIAQATWSR